MLDLNKVINQVSELLLGNCINLVLEFVDKYVEQIVRSLGVQSHKDVEDLRKLFSCGGLFEKWLNAGLKISPKFIMIRVLKDVLQFRVDLQISDVVLQIKRTKTFVDSFHHLFVKVAGPLPKFIKPREDLYQVMQRKFL